MLTKEELREYRDVEIERQGLEENIVRAKSNLEKITTMLSKMPGSRARANKLEQQVERIEELEEMLIAKMSELAEKNISIERAINKLKPIERALIRHRYIDGEKWHIVACKIDYEWAQMHRLHAKTLKKLKDDTQ